MIKLIDILKEITEGKQVGTLYHYTTLKNAIQILKDNALKRSTESQEDEYGNERDGISFTRFSHTNVLGSSDDHLSVRLKLDGDKLSNKYKTSPYHWSFDSGAEGDEAEEIIRVDIIPNLNQYLLGVDIFVEGMEGKNTNYYSLPRNFSLEKEDKQKLILKQIDELELLYPKLGYYKHGKYTNKNEFLSLLNPIK
jgi:hypothetical protein